MSYTNIYHIDLSLVTYRAFSIWLWSSINLSMHPLGTVKHLESLGTLLVCLLMGNMLQASDATQKPEGAVNALVIV